MSKPAYVQVFDLPAVGKIAAVVMDAEEFKSVIDEFEMAEGWIGDSTGSNMSRDSNKYEDLRKGGHIPGIFRGTKTERFFRRYNVPDDVNVMSACVRGLAKRMQVLS